MANATIQRIQQALKDKGGDPGDIDGIWGRKSINALKQFQAKEGLVADGIVGPKTMAVLFPAQSGNASASSGTSVPTNTTALNTTSAPFIPWLAEAEKLVGTKEVLGTKSNPTILDWADTLDIHYASDDVPWCGLFVAHCIASTLGDEILPRNPLGARQWEKFGTETTPRLGAIMVFWRESLASGKGHVGFYVGEDEKTYQILGGNQADSVCLTWLSKDRLRGARWPGSAGSLQTGPIQKTSRQHGLSSNEQ